MTNPLCPKTERERDEARAERDQALALLSETKEALRGLVEERRAVIDCINIYGDATLHKALDDAGLLGDERACPVCHGDGEVTVNTSRPRDPQQDRSERCPACRGSGYRVVSNAEATEERE